MESMSRISSLLETARDLTLDAARDAVPRRGAARPLPAAQIKKLLDSRHEREVLDGLRRVTAMQYATPPQPTLAFFPAVLKTLSHPYPSVRPLVYNYLLHHAEADPDTALLAINTIQKSLSDTNPRVRAMALKTIAGIRVPAISQLVVLAIRRGISDLSPVVRKAAALACVKCRTLDPHTTPQVEESIATLLVDTQYYVAGAAVQAFMEVCPHRLDLIHPVYRRLCRMAVDMDEWGQLALLRLMTGYARRCFPRRTKRVARAHTQEEKARDFYADLEPDDADDAGYEEVDLVDPDLELLLSSIQPLLQSRNSAVIVSVARAYLYLSPTNYLHHAIGPLIALLRSPLDTRQVALHDIVQVCLAEPTLFVPHLRHFLIRSRDTPQTWRLKLEVLTLIFPFCARDVQDLVLAELEHFSRGHDAELVRESVRAIGRCAQSSDAVTSRRCLSLLLKQIHSPDQTLVGEAIEVVRHLIQRAPAEHSTTVIRLAKNLDSLTSPMARASIIWLVGEFAGFEPESNIAADVLRILVKSYADEADEVRAQIVLLAVKVYLHYLNAKNANQSALDALNGDRKDDQATSTTGLESYGEDGQGFRENTFGDTSTVGQHDPVSEEKAHPIELLYQHTMLLARYTPSYDLRDRARLFRALLAVPRSTELASLILLAPKPVPQAPSPSETRRHFALASASLVVGDEAGASGLKGYEAIPEWVKEGQEPDPRLRHEAAADTSSKYAAPQKSVSASQRLEDALQDEGITQEKFDGRSGRRAKTLDDWLDEEDEGEETSEEEETEESNEESSTESESETDEETESEEDEEAELVR